MSEPYIEKGLTFIQQTKQKEQRGAKALQNYSVVVFVDFRFFFVFFLSCLLRRFWRFIFVLAHDSHLFLLPVSSTDRVKC